MINLECINFSFDLFIFGQSFLKTMLGVEVRIFALIYVPETEKTVDRLSFKSVLKLLFLHYKLCQKKWK